MAKNDRPRPLDLIPLVNRFFPGYSLRPTAADPVERERRGGAYYLLVTDTGHPVDIGDVWGTPVVTDTGHPVDIGKNIWGTAPGFPVVGLFNSQLDEFLRGREIPITDANGACSFAQLIRGLTLGPCAVGSHFVTAVEAKEAGWLVTFYYVGPGQDVGPTYYFIGITNGILLTFQMLP